MTALLTHKDEQIAQLRSELDAANAEIARLRVATVAEERRRGEASMLIKR